jgi:hypothetical protein
MGFKVAVVYFSRRGRLVVLANVIAAGARQVASKASIVKVAVVRTLVGEMSVSHMHITSTVEQ